MLDCNYKTLIDLKDMQFPHPQPITPFPKPHIDDCNRVTQSWNKRAPNVDTRTARADVDYTRMFPGMF